jgi:hypothetical protein
VKYCRQCRVVYPDSYNFCPNHGLRFVAPEWAAAQECPSCGNLGEQRDGFCGKCGAQLKQQDSPEIANGAELEEPAPKTESEITPPLSQQMQAPAEAHDSSVFRKKINDDLTEAFASLHPSETPWFGMDFDGDLLAVTPYGITVTEIIDPGTIENGTIHQSTSFSGPWLLCMPDGTDFSIENPIERGKRAIRRVEDKLIQFFRDRHHPLRNRITGLVVFPDRYHLNMANEHRTFVEQRFNVRVVNARELTREMLRPVQAERLDPELCREWLSTSVLHNPDDDSIALTWLDPNGETISETAHSFAAQKPMNGQRKAPWPELAKPFSNEIGALPRRRGRAIAKIAGSSLVIGLGLFALWQVYEPNTRLFESSLARRVLGKNIPKSEIPADEYSLAANEPNFREVPGEKDSSRFTDALAPSNGNHRANSIRAPGEALPTVPPEKSLTDRDPAAPTSSPQKAMESQIGKAINQRAVEGVLVSFVNDTAYLTGAVLSEKQKAAAEEAARNVPGVKRVQSSISVKWASG